MSKRLTREEIMQILLQEIHSVGVSLPENVSEKSSFQEDLKMDSLALIEYISRIEQAFQVEISDDEWQTLSTLELVLNYVEEYYSK